MPSSPENLHIKSIKICNPLPSHAQFGRTGSNKQRIERNSVNPESQTERLTMGIENRSNMHALVSNKIIS